MKDRVIDNGVLKDNFNLRTNCNALLIECSYHLLSGLNIKREELLLFTYNK